MIHAEGDIADDGEHAEHDQVERQRQSPVFAGKIRNAKRDKDTVWHYGPSYVGQNEYDTQDHSNESGDLGARGAVTLDICTKEMRWTQWTKRTSKQRVLKKGKGAMSVPGMRRGESLRRSRRSEVFLRLPEKAHACGGVEEAFDSNC